MKKSENPVISRVSRFSKSTLWYAYPWRDSEIYLFYVILAVAVPIVIKNISNKVIFACKQSQKYVRRGKMNVKSHGFDFPLDMNTLAQGLRKTEPLLFILRYRILRTPINF